MSIWHKNEPIIEGYGSYTENNYTRESVQVVFSVTDVMTSMVIAVLQDRHFLKYSDKVATYWPEFAQNGKENITIAQVLRHESGLDIFEQPITWGQFVNHLGESEEPIHKLIERTTPAFPPAIRSLHGFTRGIILDEIAKRVDPSKRRLSQIWEDEIRKPLKIDCFMGLPSELMNRFHISQKWSGSYQFIHLMLPYMVYPSIVDPGTRKILDLYSDKEGWPRRLEKLMQFPRTTTKGGYAATEDFITSGQPSIGGICSADGLGKALAVMANKGSLNGFKLLSSDGFERSIAVTTPAMYDASRFGQFVTFRYWCCYKIY